MQKHINQTIALSEGSSSSIGHLLSHQAKLDELRTSVQRCEQKIEEQLEIIKGAEATIEPLDQGLITKRADMLALIAIGDADQSELNDLDTEIEKAKKRHRASVEKVGPLIDQATQTIQGLQRKNDALRGQLADVEKQTPKVLDLYLKEEVTRVSDQYVEAANLTKDAFLRLLALERIYSKATGSRTANFIKHELSLPIPLSASYRQHGLPHDINMMIVANSYYFHVSPHVNNKEVEELERMRGDGCCLL